MFGLSKTQRLRRAAERGHAESQMWLGYAYQVGQGVQQDYAEAIKWYRLAAAQGHAGSQCNLGVMYQNGEGVPQDYREAASWFYRSAVQGYAPAQFNLAGLYGTGRGVSLDDAEAVKRYRLAAAQGVAAAQDILDAFEHEGRGVARQPRTGTPDLSQRIFTRALLRSATAAGDSIQKEADRVGLTLDLTTPPSTDLDGVIAGAIRLMTGEIVRVVLERLGRINDLVPLSSGSRLPNDAAALMAYAGLVTLALYAQVKREGCIVPLNVVMKGLGEAIFFAWPKAQVNAVRETRFKMYNFLLDPKHPVMKELAGDVSKCVTFYIEQHGIEESKLKDTDIVYLLSRVFEQIAGSVVVNR
jgi:hypothetical protein